MYRDRMDSGCQWESRRIFLSGIKRKNLLLVRRAEIAPRAYKFLWTSINIRWNKTTGSKSSRNKDLSWLAIPIGADNLGGDFIFKKTYTSARPTSRMLQELAAHSLTTNIAIISKRQKWNSGEWSIWADKLSRTVSTKCNGAVQRAPEWGCLNYWFANIRCKYVVELLGPLPLKGKNVSPNLALLKWETP